MKSDINNSATAGSSAEIIPITATSASGKRSFEAVREQTQRQIAADGKLIATTKLIGIAISWFMNGKLGGEARPGIDTLAAVTATPRRTVIRAVKELDRRHYDVRRSKRPDGTQAVNRYFPILKPLAPGATDDTRHRVPNDAKPGAKSCTSRVPPVALEPPIDEPPIEPPREREEPRPSASAASPNAYPIIQIKRVAEAERIGTNIITSDNPSLPSNRSLRGKRLPDDWKPLPDDEAYARGLLGDNGFATTLENFRDYWLSLPGPKAIKLDWSRTWRRWCREDAAKRPAHSANGTVEDARRRIGDQTATAADVYLVKNADKIRSGIESQRTVAHFASVNAETTVTVNWEPSEEDRRLAADRVGADKVDAEVELFKREMCRLRDRGAVPQKPDSWRRLWLSRFYRDGSRR